MTTITKERIELFIKNPLENGLTRGEQMELARIAMASLEAKPVRYLNKFSGVCVTLEQQSNAADDVAVYIPLYTAQPAPVVPDEMATSDDMNLYQKSFAQGYNACRAAMLQGVEPVSNHDELALYYLQGQKDGLEWAAQLAEANHPLTGDWLYDDPLELAKAIRKGPDMPEFAGSSPVTQDGWISCSERMPAQDDWVLIYSKYGEYLAGQVQGEYVELNDGTLSWLGAALHWMPLPEPPQEVK